MLLLLGNAGDQAVQDRSLERSVFASGGPVLREILWDRHRGRTRIGEKKLEIDKGKVKLGEPFTSRRGGSGEW